MRTIRVIMRFGAKYAIPEPLKFINSLLKKFLYHIKVKKIRIEYSRKRKKKKYLKVIATKCEYILKPDDKQTMKI